MKCVTCGQPIEQRRREGQPRALQASDRIITRSACGSEGAGCRTAFRADGGMTGIGTASRAFVFAVLLNCMAYKR